MSAHNGCVTDSDPDLYEPCTIVESLEDIEHPAWVSTSSFSESCGSYLSRISSFCHDGKPSNSSETLDLRTVPDHSPLIDFEMEKVAASTEHIMHLEENTNGRTTPENAPCAYNEDNIPFTASGSLNSLASSSKTVYASPRSKSRNKFYSHLNHPSVGGTLQSRGSLYRERAPSENSLDFTNLSRLKDSKLSHSLHDVSCISSNDLKNPLRRSAGASLSTLHLRNRSRDSGFIHSGSLLSLSSGSRNYDHVESKVKRYIQEIKDADAIRRIERAQTKALGAAAHLDNTTDCFSEPQERLEVIDLVQKLQHDLEEKDHLLSKIQEDYKSLLGKYAEAQNKIDKFRFGWYESSPSAPHDCARAASSNKTESSNNMKLLSQSSVLSEIDDSSFSSSMLQSNGEAFDSPNSCFYLKEKQLKNINHKKKIKKEIVISAPLRPISSLYCTSLRLDQVMTPLNSKSPISSSASSANHHCNASSMAKKKIEVVDGGFPDSTIREGTTDTGIYSNCPLSTEGLSVTQSKTEPIGHLPHDDPFLKVMRWQKSFSTSSQPHAAFSPFSKRSSQNRTQTTESSFETMNQHHTSKQIVGNKSKTTSSSIGIQVNERDVVDLPSTISRNSTPLVPCLNLGELSGCTDDFSGSLLSSECEKNKSASQPSSKLNLKSPCFEPSKSFSSNNGLSSTSKHACGRRCKVHGSNMKSRSKRTTAGWGGEEKNSQCFPGQNNAMPRNQVSSASKSSERVQKKISQLSGSELAKLISFIWKDQDHVVPSSPEEERSYQHAFQTLEKKMNSLKNSVNLQTFVSLLDLLLEKVPLKECSCHHDQSFPDVNGTQAASARPDSLDIPDENGSLLQCLEELDEYTNQVWAKTESFLEAFNSKKYPSSLQY